MQRKSDKAAVYTASRIYFVVPKAKHANNKIFASAIMGKMNMYFRQTTLEGG